MTILAFVGCFQSKFCNLKIASLGTLALLERCLHKECFSCRYGILVLVVEMLGATTTLLYGLNILFDPVHETLPQDSENPGLKLVHSLSGRLFLLLRDYKSQSIHLSLCHL